ncbi:MAG TPA: phenylalanine--tRNA ligase beta subunit-related protein [Ktedonobacterales bacterium]|nr:phenylalanine--tRNA ligase beta subunit-related protein [Ktedonobacterales bacterium]
MEFTIEPAIFERFPGISIAVAVAREIDNEREQPAIAARWREDWMAASAAASYGNAQSHPRVRPWRERFQAMGVSGKEFPSSIEALLRRSMKGGEPFSINPLVDWYNTLSLRHVVPVGAFDLEALPEPLELRLSRAGDTFTSLDADAALAVPPGEVSYASGPVILTRHFVWRQAKTGLVTPTTREAFLVSEVLGEVGRAVAEAVVADFRAGLRDYFGVGCETFVLDARARAIAW